MIQPIGDRHYHIIKPLGKGGCGETYLAKALHLPNQPECVVKKFKPTTDDRFFLKTARLLFDTEIKVLYQLGNYDFIPQFLDHFELEEEFYLVQEYIEGHDLSKEIIWGNKIQENQALEILKSVLEILVFVHQQGIIHRDIKPKNLIRRDRDGKIFLIDFGLVQQLNSQNRKVSVGTQGYMPIEQSDGKPRFCSDIYALGITIITALTGIKPEELLTDSQGEISWRNQAPQVSDRLVDIISKMVKSYYSDRYQSAIEVLQDILSVNNLNYPINNNMPIADNNIINISKSNHQPINFIIPPQFDNVGTFSEGLAEVTIRNKWGYINKNGNVVIPAEFDYGEPFYQDLALVNLGEKNGYIDKKGNLVIPANFNQAYSFSENLAAIEINEKWGFLNSQGNIIIQPKFTNANSFMQGIAAVQIEDKWGFIDKKGNIIIPAEFENVGNFTSELAQVQINQKWGYINKQGKMIIPPQFDSAASFLEGLAAVKIGEEYGYIDKTGKLVIPLQFAGADSFYEGIAAVKIGDKVGYINKTGKIIITPQFEEINEYFMAYPFCQGLAAVEIEGNWGYIDNRGNVVIPVEFTDANSFSEGMAAVEIDYLWGYISHPRI